MLDKSAFLVLCLVVSSFGIYAQKCKLNHIDENGLQQGYWKVSRPDANGHNTIFYEGLYYNGKQVGVWKCWNSITRFIYNKQIYSDTLGEQFDLVNYYHDEKVESQGHMILKFVHDSVQSYDRVTDSIKWDTVKLISLKSGLWKFFWENGNLKETGEYYNDERKGIWSFYNESGVLLRKEEY
jgi:antitoxin component YwqK of YwqJK toxin-antitoxin module